MRVVQASVRYPPAPGGAETHVRALATGLDRRGHDVRVVTSDLRQEVPFRRDPDLPREVDGVPVTRLPAWSPGGESHYVFQRGLLRHLLEVLPDADVLHAHSYGYHQTWAGALAARVTDTPFVLTPHYHPPWSMEGGPKRGLLRGLYDGTLGPLSLRAAHRVLGVSRAEVDLMGPLGLDDDRVRIVPNGIHLDRFTPVPDGARFRDALDLDGPLVLFAGRLAVNKGLHHLVGALPRVLEAHPDATLVLAGGDQDQGPRLRRLARELDVEEHVRMPGHLPQELLTSAFGAADVLALPSEYEAFGIVLLEAMACRTPVVATARGGAPEVVDDGVTGHVVPYGDPDALADALRRILGDPRAAARMGEAGRARVEERYTWDAVVDEVERIYREIRG